MPTKLHNSEKTAYEISMLFALSSKTKTQDSISVISKLALVQKSYIP